MSLPAPNLETINLSALGLTVLAALAMLRFHLGIVPTLALCGGGALLLHFLL